MEASSEDVLAGCRQAVEENLNLAEGLRTIASAGVATGGICRPEQASALHTWEAALKLDTRLFDMLLVSFGENAGTVAAAYLALGGQLQQWLALQEALFDPPHEGGGSAVAACGDRGVDVRCRLAALLAQVALLAQHSCRMTPQQQAELLSGVAPALAKYAGGAQAGGLRLPA